METLEEQVERIAAERKGTKRKRGRPKLELDERVIAEAAKMQCTMPEIAALAKCSIDTLERNYAALIENARSEGRASLRRQQYLVAMDPRNRAQATMLIWLGKTILGQQETANLNHSGLGLEGLARALAEEQHKK